jgi:hypothetical protein
MFSICFTAEKLLVPELEKFLIALVSPVTWEIVDEYVIWVDGPRESSNEKTKKSKALIAMRCFIELFFRYQLADGEQVLTVKTLMLESRGSRSGMRPFVVVGTAIVRGEDVTVKGRVSFTVVF